MESPGPCALRDGVAHTAARVPSCSAIDLPNFLSPKASLRRSPPLACTALPAPSALERCSQGSAKRPFIFLIRQVGEKRCGTVCAIWGLYRHAPSIIRQSVHLCMPHVNRGTRQTPSRPRPLQRGLSAHLLQ